MTAAIILKFLLHFRGQRRLFPFKGNAQFIFVFNLQKTSVNDCFIKILKSSVIKKVIVLKVPAFVIFPTSVMDLSEIQQRFKGHFLKELCISFNGVLFAQQIPNKLIVLCMEVLLCMYYYEVAFWL